MFWHVLKFFNHPFSVLFFLHDNAHAVVINLSIIIKKSDASKINTRDKHGWVPTFIFYFFSKRQESGRDRSA